MWAYWTGAGSRRVPCKCWIKLFLLLLHDAQFQEKKTHRPVEVKMRQRVSQTLVNIRRCPSSIFDYVKWRRRYCASVGLLWHQEEVVSSEFDQMDRRYGNHVMKWLILTRYRSNKVTVLSTTIPQGGLVFEGPFCAKNRVLILLLTTIKAILGEMSVFACTDASRHALCKQIFQIPFN